MTDALRVLVVDDEALARSRLRTLLADCKEPAAIVVAEAANAVQAMQALQHDGAVDLALLDIHMPGADGLALAQTMKGMMKAPAVVFVTAHPEHAVHAFELEALDYLTKPVRIERLQVALEKAMRFKQTQPGPAASLQEVIVIQDRGRTERVPLNEVLYLKAELKYITVRTARKSYILDGALAELEERYPQHFLRVHRNALVARSAIRAIEKHYDAEEGESWAVRLLGLESEVVAVSRRQLSAVRAVVAA